MGALIRHLLRRMRHPMDHLAVLRSELHPTVVLHSAIHTVLRPTPNADLTTSGEEGPNVFRQQTGFFHCREMATPRHHGPALNIERSFCPAAWRP